MPENIKTGSIVRNPALGLRGIRYSLNYNNIFINQIKAILRVSNLGNVKIMLPMITTISEIHKAKELIKEGKRDEARDILDACICIIGEIKYTNKRTDEDELEGVTISVWLKRFWN